MAAEFTDAPGDVIEPGALVTPKARELMILLGAGVLPHLRLIECRRDSEHEIVVLEVEPEVPQRPVHDIRRLERIAVRFDPWDRYAPDPLALRRDFPRVPHTNFRPVEHPRSLCLFEERYEDQKLRWTAAGFAKQLHCWLSRTARGELHEPDQPLEPFFLGSLTPLAVPDRFYSTERGDLPTRLAVAAVPFGSDGMTLIATEGVPTVRRGERIAFVGITVEGMPRAHGTIRLQPTDLSQLHGYLAEVGCDLLALLRERLRAWRYAEPDLLGMPAILIVRLPKRRGEGGAPESVEVWAFATLKSLREIGEALGMWSIQGDHLTDLIGGGEERPDQIALDLLNPMPALTRERAAHLNGGSGATDQKIVGVGAGALGSQVATNLARAGFGIWCVVDEDRLLPHNLARHQLDGSALGFAKAYALPAVMNTLFEGEKVAQGVVADVLDSPGEDLAAAMKEADVILDMSASVTVARHLAHDAVSPGRRVSLFLNPDGTDLVLLAEGAERRIRLDELEIQYYRALLHRPELARHLLREGERLRYAHACRDVTATIPQDLIGLHAGIGARAVRQACDHNGATLSIWQTGEDLSVSVVRVDPVEYTRFRAGDWTIAVDGRLLSTLFELRAAKLPNETGGVLIGSFDLQRRIGYVVDMIPSPPDSEEWPTLYIRGHAGLRERVEEIGRLTGGWLQYVGEWHSHPAGASCKPSGDDRTVFAWLSGYMAEDGLPPMMAIVGGRGESRWFLGSI